jgi:hypothetical protein
VIHTQNADHGAVDLQRNGYLGARIGFTRKVIRIHADVPGVAHPTSRGGVSNHTATADLLSLLEGGAATHTVQDHVVALGIPQPDRDLNAADRESDIVDDAVEQNLEIESGGDQLRAPLQLHQRLDEVAGGMDTRGGCCELGCG